MLKKYISRTDVKIFLFSALFLLIFIKPTVDYGVACSRVATIQSLAEKGTFAIDDSIFTFDCKDKIYLDCKFHSSKICGHYYSEKPPFLSVVGAGIYSVLNRTFELDIRTPYTLFILIFLIDIIPFSLLLVIFYRSLGFVNLKEKYKLLLTLGLGFGTALLAYTNFLNNSIPATALFFTSFYFLIKSKFREDLNIASNLLLTGLLVGFASIIEYTTLTFIPLFLIYILLTPKLRSKLLYFIAGAIIPLSIHAVINYHIFETFKPAYFIKGAFTYPDSFWIVYNAANQQSSGLIIDIYHLILGNAGLFTFSPILIIPFIYFLLSLSSKKHELKKEAWIAFIGMCIIYYVYITRFRTSYTSLGFGFRFGFMLIPVILFFGAYFFKDKPHKSLLILFYAIFIFSIAVSFIGLLAARGWIQPRSLLVWDIFPVIFFIAFALLYSKN